MGASDFKCDEKRTLGEKYHNKKIVLLYGNCHLKAMEKILSHVFEKKEKYIIYPIAPIYEMKDASYFEHPVFRMCDVFIHQSIQLKNRYGEEYASQNVFSRLKPSCVKIALPNLYHLPMCFFPQYSEEKEFVINGNSTIFFRDKVIDELFRKNYNLKQIQKEYLRNDLFDKEKLESDFEAFIRKIKKREEDWDIKVSEFILENYKTTQLFYDPNHPTPAMIEYIVKQCLVYMNVEFENQDIKVRDTFYLDSYEMPVCSSVKNVLGLRFADKELRVTGIKIKREPMYLKQYISQYMAFQWQNKEIQKILSIKSKICYNVMKLKNRMEWGRVKGMIKKILLKLYFKVYIPTENKIHVAMSKHKIAKLKDKYKGKRCFIIGNGPSLTGKDLDKLKNEYTFAANRIYKIYSQTDWRPTFYGIQDSKIIDAYGSEIKKAEAQYYFMPILVNRKNRFVDNTLYLKLDATYNYPEEPGFSEDISKIVYEGMTITYTNIQIAAYLGFSEIYLLGVDHNYAVNLKPDGTLEKREGVKSYFSEDYNCDKYEDGTFFAPQLEKSTLAYETAMKVAQKKGIKIFNATRGGKLEAFPRQDFDTLF